MLVFVPLVLMAPRAQLADVINFVSGFLLFGLMTSGTYLINDILDVEADRRHPNKSLRPIPNGDLALPVAAAFALGLIGLALFGSFLLNRAFGLAAGSYLVLTLAYSLWLKQAPLLDVLAIAALFTLRIVAGIALVSEPPTEWLLMFSIFFFFSMALMKREGELGAMKRIGADAIPGRGYLPEDRMLLQIFGVSAGVASLVVFALFVWSMATQPSSNYRAPQLLWGAMAILSYWMMRMWLLTVRGRMHDDPILYAIHDRSSLLMAALTILFVFAAQVVQI